MYFYLVNLSTNQRLLDAARHVRWGTLLKIHHPRFYFSYLQDGNKSIKTLFLYVKRTWCGDKALPRFSMNGFS